MSVPALLRRTFLLTGTLAAAGFLALPLLGRKRVWAAPGAPVTLTFAVTAPDQDAPLSDA